MALGGDDPAMFAGDRTIQEPQNLAKSRLTTPKLRVLALAAALAYEADEGTSGWTTSSGRFRRRCGWRRGAEGSRTKARRCNHG